MTLGYVLSRYPLLSETFILREMWELERQGHRLRVYPLRRVRGRRHARVAALRAPVWWAPWLGPLGCHLRWLRRRPGAYLGTLAAALWHNRSDANLWAGAVAYWGKAVAIAERLERDGVEQIHAHYATHPALVAYVAHRLTGIPYSFTVHAHDLYCHRAMLGQKAGRASAVVCISRFNRDLLRRRVPEPRAAVEVIHCGVECAAYAAQAAARRAAPAAGGALRLLAVGSLQPYKGHAHLVAACAELRRRGVALECRIVGGGGLQRALRRQIVGLGLEAQVRLDGPGTEDEVRAALAWAQVFVLPSVVVARTGKMEGIPVALMEAMAAGLPVVASRLAGIPELVEDEAGGLLVAPADARALAAALLRLRDPELRRRLGQAGRRRVEAEFELAASVARLARLWSAPARPGPPAAREEVAA
ncbi:MAG TPA: glycosyltransferase family 4 protein [Terriglobales bacterium]|nr:glycosyltransferase family 4 protein [Terriglobales bacterium]